jgi:hypothetical protein
MLYGALSSKSPPENPDNQYSACDVAQRFVKRQLVAPTTAEFPTLCSSAVHGSDGVWTVYTTVDAQNSFGAKIRAYYEVKVKYNPADSNWYKSELLEMPSDLAPPQD